MKLLSLAALAGALALAGAANASVVFSEDFNAAGFEGASLGLNPAEQFSDRWVHVDYTRINEFNGWDFSDDGAYYVRNTDDRSQGAVLLNENGGIALQLLNGLVAGQTYTVSLLLNGDNRPGGTYNLQADLNGANVFSQFGTDLAAGANPGLLVDFVFTAAAGANTLRFYQTGSSGEASPIIDNVTVSSAAVPEPATWGLMILGFGGAGALLRRRRAALA